MSNRVFLNHHYYEIKTCWLSDVNEFYCQMCCLVHTVRANAATVRLNYL